MSELVPKLHSFVVLDNDGERLLAKFYDGRDKTAQSNFEATLHKKTRMVPAKAEVEVMPLENELVVFRSGGDVKLFVSGPVDENELILVGVLDCIYETVNALLRGMVESSYILDNLELVLLTLDEVLDHGNILELDPANVVSRVLMRNSDGNNGEMGDLSLSQALGMATAQLMKSVARDGM
jgi:coatomer subunit zeta